MSRKASAKELDQVEAAEYVLRLLSRDQERAFETRMNSVPALEGYVSKWVQHFAPLNAEIDPVKPPAIVRGRLMTDLFGDDPTPAPYWQTHKPWRILTFLLGGLAAVMAASLLIMTSFFQTPQGGSGPLYVSEITSKSNRIRLLALYEAENGTLRLSRTTGEVDGDRSLQIWAIQGDMEPVSLGFVSTEPRSSVVLPPAVREDLSRLIFAVSEEPSGGSDTGKPSGEILAAGRLTGM